jgi:Protein of unknown function (DUF1036)
MKQIICILCYVILAVFPPIEVNAQLIIRNNKSYFLRVAIANYYTTRPGTGSIEGWGTTYWYYIRPNGVVTVLDQITTRYIYIFAMNEYEGGEVLTGNHRFLVSNNYNVEPSSPLWRCTEEWFFNESHNRLGTYRIALFHSLDVEDYTKYTFTID